MKQPVIVTFDDEKYTLFRYRILPSTNTFLKEHLEDFPEFAVIWAQKQTAGKGRFTRRWASSAGKDLTFSLLLPLNIIEKGLWQNIPQIAALAVAEILDKYGVFARIKWPNDILTGEKKISGILCETVTRNTKYCAVLGIGVNVNSSQKTLKDIPSPATSLYNEIHTAVPLEALCVKLAGHVFHHFLELSQRGFLPFRDAILKRLAFLNEEKEVVDGNNRHTGIIRGINPDGTLRFECSDGEILALHAGEVSFTRTSCRPSPSYSPAHR